MPASHDGGCLCGAIRYRLEAEPLTLYACHCTDCQRHTAAAYGLSMPVPREALHVLRGEPARYEAQLEGGRVWHGCFCGRCATRLWSEPQRMPQLANLRPGTLDDTRWLSPVAHIWTRSAQPGVVIPEGVLRYEQQPQDYGPMLRVWQERTRG